MGDHQITRILAAVRRCTRIFWHGKASERTPRGVIPPVSVKYRRMPQEKEEKNITNGSKKAE
jgi:hypothetical protein